MSRRYLWPMINSPGQYAISPASSQTPGLRSTRIIELCYIRYQSNNNFETWNCKNAIWQIRVVEERLHREADQTYLAGSGRALTKKCYFYSPEQIIPGNHLNISIWTVHEQNSCYNQVKRSRLYKCKLSYAVQEDSCQVCHTHFFLPVMLAATLIRCCTGRGRHNPGYTLSLPLISLDRTKAFIQVGYHCGNLCGYGKNVYLRKEGGAWKIVKSYETWVSWQAVKNPGRSQFEILYKSSLSKAWKKQKCFSRSWCCNYSP